MNDKFLRRLFEPFPEDGMNRFKVGDRVRLAREEIHWGFPAGLEGVVIYVDHPSGGMASKGRPYEVRMDVGKFKIPYPDDIRQMILNETGEDHPYYETVSIHLSPNDLEALNAGPVVDAGEFVDIDLDDNQVRLLTFLNEHIIEIVAKAQNGSEFCASMVQVYASWQDYPADADLVTCLIKMAAVYRKWVATRAFTAATDALTFGDMLQVPDDAHRVYKMLDNIGFWWEEEAGMWHKKAE